MYEQSRNSILTADRLLLSDNKECYTSDAVLSKLFSNDQKSICKSQLNDVQHYDNCKTLRDNYQDKSNQLPTASLSSLGFPLINPFVDYELSGRNMKKKTCSYPKKCSSFLGNILSDEHISHNPVSSLSNLLHKETSLHLFNSSLIGDKQERIVNTENMEHWNLDKEKDPNSCVRLVSGQIKSRNELTVSDFITSAIKYDNVSKYVRDNGTLIETLANTNNLEMCWVKLVQIKENFEGSIVNLSSELVFIHSSKRHHLLVGINEKSGGKHASRMLWPHFNAKSFN
ncbi:unnamed protein product, partial [Heterobilharzia americana]